MSGAVKMISDERKYFQIRDDGCSGAPMSDFENEIPPIFPSEEK
jgi:hypothetical protein